jgi:hypothetical protein
MVEVPHHRCGFSTIVGHGAIVATQTSRVVGRLCLDPDGAVTRGALRTGTASPRYRRCPSTGSYRGARQLVAHAQTANALRCGLGADGVPMTLPLVVVSRIRSAALS